MEIRDVSQGAIGDDPACGVSTMVVCVLPKHETRVRFSYPAPHAMPRGYRIMAIMRPCQGRETGPIPVTRSKEKIPSLGWDFFFCSILGAVIKSIIFSMSLATLILIGFAVLLAALIGVYNSLVTKRNRVRGAWADIDVQLKRRYDLVPNLVETVKGYTGYEAATLEKVTAARTQAMSAEKGTGLAGRAQAEAMLSSALTGFFGLAEGYPELKASENFKQLQEQLSSLENDIQSARRYYNAAVREFNTATQSFPTNLISGPLNFKHAEFFGVAEGERDAVKVSF